MNNLTSLLFFVGVIWSANAFCGYSPKGSDNADECKFNGTPLAVGETKTINCYSVTCGELGINWCYNANRISYHAPECKVILSEDGCNQRAVLIDDESVECPSSGGVGR